ncbi:MAG TPA: ACT domain-containing protein [Coriobacteriia bacterium]
MKVKQLAVFIENKPGRVSEIADLMGRVGVNIRGFSVSDTAEYGIMRLVVDKPDEARAALKDAGFTVREDEVICVELPDEPGALGKVLLAVSEAGVNIEYVYSLVGTAVVLNVSDADRALRLLEGRPVKLMSQEDIATYAR